ncbi:MAG: hypothetical protein VX278_03405 [Myxococcota bacterium]|nr:hypothetical protein [Myxococcota bacterium]
MLLLWMACLNPKVQDSAGEIHCSLQTPSLEIGTGESSFEPIAEGASLVMVHGPQGGWHMLGSMSLLNTGPVVELDFRIYDEESGVIVSDNHYRVGLVMDTECSGFYPGMYGYLNVSGLSVGDLDTPPELLGGHILRMEMDANDCTASQDEAGQCVRAERWSNSEILVEAALDPIDM